MLDYQEKSLVNWNQESQPAPLRASRKVQFKASSYDEAMEALKPAPGPFGREKKTEGGGAGDAKSEAKPESGFDVSMFKIRQRRGKGYGWLAKKVTATMQERGFATYKVSARALRSQMLDQMIHPITYEFNPGTLLAGLPLSGGRSPAQIQRDQAGMRYWENGGREKWLAKQRHEKFLKELEGNEALRQQIWKLIETGGTAAIEGATAAVGWLLNAAETMGTNVVEALEWLRDNCPKEPAKEGKGPENANPDIPEIKIPEFEIEDGALSRSRQAFEDAMDFWSVTDGVRTINEISVFVQGPGKHLLNVGRGLGPLLTKVGIVANVGSFLNGLAKLVERRRTPEEYEEIAVDMLASMVGITAGTILLTNSARKDVAVYAMGMMFSVASAIPAVKRTLDTIAEQKASIGSQPDPITRE